MVHLLMESSNWEKVIEPVEGIDDAVDVIVVEELGMSPSEGVGVVEPVETADGAPKDKETGAELLVVKEVPNVSPE